MGGVSKLNEFQNFNISILPGWFDYFSLYLTIGVGILTPFVLWFATQKANTIIANKSEQDRLQAIRIDYTKQIFKEIKILNSLEDWNKNPNFREQIQNIKIILDDEDLACKKMMATLDLAHAEDKELLLAKLSRNLDEIRKGL